jgi:hypothetical protein
MTFVRPALIGDTTLDGVVNSDDINQIISQGHFDDLTTNNSWTSGDFTTDGKVDSDDINAIISSGRFDSGISFNNLKQKTVPAAKAVQVVAPPPSTTSNAAPIVTTTKPTLLNPAAFYTPPISLQPVQPLPVPAGTRKPKVRAALATVNRKATPFSRIALVDQRHAMRMRDLLRKT